MGILRVAVSGYFNPLHIGHIQYFKAAKEIGQLIVIVNNDWQAMLKGNMFMPELERMEIIKNLKMVDKVVLSIDNDETVCKTLEKVRPYIFAKGGDRYIFEIPERDICGKLGIKIIDCVGGFKIQSSTALLKRKYG